MNSLRAFLLLVILSCYTLTSQEILKGKVMFSENNNDIPIQGANVYWEKSDIGTITNQNGDFNIKLLQNKKLVISYVGFITDTITVTNKLYIEHYLKESNSEFLDEVTVTRKRRSSQRTYLMPQNIINVSEEELLKAACCNLSESFETNPSVDVNHNDAITGTKQIEMLGLKSPYLLRKIFQWFEVHLKHSVLVLHLELGLRVSK